MTEFEQHEPVVGWQARPAKAADVPFEGGPWHALTITIARPIPERIVPHHIVGPDGMRHYVGQFVDAIYRWENGAYVYRTGL